MVGGISGVEGRWFLPDYENSRVLALSADLGAAQVIGQFGQGPGELQGAIQSFCDQNRLFVGSDQSQTIVSFDLNGRFLDRIPVSGYIFATRFAVVDETVFVSAPQSQPIAALSMEGDVLYRMGSAFASPDPRTVRARDLRHLFPIELDDVPHILAASLSEPIVELFSLEGDLVWRRSLVEHPALQARLEEAELGRAKDANPGKTYSLFADAYLDRRELWLYVYANQPPHRFLRFHVDRKGLTERETHQLAEPIWVCSFASRGETLLVFEGKSRELWTYR